MIKQIIEELNISNSSNYKLDILKKYKDNEQLKRVLKMTYDNVSYNYGVGKTTLKKLTDISIQFSNDQISLEQGLDVLEFEFATRKLTGNAAFDKLVELCSKMIMDDFDILCKVIERDLRINIGRTQINKVHKDLIIKPAYMRCDVLTKKTAKNIKYKAILQKKSDGTYREFAVDSEEISTRSRSGESYNYPLINEKFSILQQDDTGAYIGELTVRASERTIKAVQEKLDYAIKKFKPTEELEEIIAKYNDSLINKYEYILPRSIGNGLINSDEPPHEDIILELWDYVTFEEYQQARKKDKKNPCKTTYNQRFETLKNKISKINSHNIRIIEHTYVDNSEDVKNQNKIWMEKGYEGSILKDLSAVFEDGTSKKQLKIKLKISIEVRIVGYQDGTSGTKREGLVGSVIFENDEGTIKGRTSGFDDDFLELISNNRDYYIGKIIEVEFNDLTRATGNSYYALSHPRFVELRDDKDETDTLEKAFELREMAMDISQYFE